MTNKQSISEKVLERIATVTPRARAYFILKNVGIWILAVLSILVGGLAISSIIFRAVNAGAALRPGLPPVSEVLLVIPFLWIILVAVFGYAAYREIRSTRKGYKYELSTLILGTLLASCVLGIGFYATGAGFILDRLAARHLPFHADLERVQRDRWLQPEQGFLVGKISSESEGQMRVIDPANIEWQVQFGHSISTEMIETLDPGERVGIRGELLDPEKHLFIACGIRSLEFEGRGLLPPPPPSPSMFLNKRERNVPPMRIKECEDVRPLD